jgi:glycosyltransferase involved in cell wall biosynthesis
MNQPQQILHLITHLDGYGQARQLRLLVEQQLAMGHDVRVIALSADRAGRAAVERQGVRCRVLGRRWKFDPIAAWRLAGDLRRLPYNLLHTWGQGAMDYAKATRPAAGAKPWVATTMKWPSGRVRCEADCLVVTGDRVKQACSAAGIAEAKIVVVPPGVALREPQAREATEFKGQLGLSSDAWLIAIAGPLRREKNIDEAIWCFELVRTLDARTRLLILGDGPDRKRLERFARLVSEPGGVHFLGYRDDLLNLLPHFDVLWQADEATAAAGVVLEAMAAKVPVVATDVAAHREIIEHGQTGLLYPVGSRAACTRLTGQLKENPSQSDAIVTAAAEEVARRFSAENMVNAYAEVYRSVIT